MKGTVSRLHTWPPIVNSMFMLLRNVAIAALALAVGLTFGLTLTGNGATWPITVVGLTLYAIVLVANPLAGLLFWVVTAPFSRFLYLDILLGRGIPDLTLTRMCAAALLILILAQLAVGKIRAPRLLGLDLAILATLIGIGLSLPASYDGFKAAVTNYADTYFVPAVIYILARFLERERRHAESVCTAIIIMGVILTSVAIQEQLGGQPLFIYSERSWVYTKDIHKLSGLLGSPAFFAALIAMSSAFVICRFTQAKTLGGRLIYALALAYVAIGVFYTYNRAGYIALALSLVLGAAVWPTFRRVFVVAVIVGAAALALSWNAVQQSAVVSQRIGARGPVEYRIEIWSNAALIFSHNPILGLGYSNFGTAYLKNNLTYADANVLPAPHNSVLEVAFNSGIVGALPYVTMFGIIIVGAVRFLRRARDRLEAGLVAAFAIALVPYLVEAMVIDMVSAYYVNMVMMLVVGALFGWQSEQQTQRQTAAEPFTVVALQTPTT